MTEELLPKPQTDLPLPEKELPAHASGGKFSILKNKFFLVFVALSFILAFLAGGFYLAKNQNNNSVEVPSPDPVVYEPTPTPGSTADWKTYKNTKYGFTFKYPSDMNSDCWDNFEHCTFDKFTGPGRGPENFIWFQLIPLDPKDRSGEYYNGNDIESFLEDGNDTVNTNPKFPDLANNFTYTRLKDKEIDSFNAMVFENNSPWESKSGTVERRNIFIKEDYIYTIGAYTESDGISLKLFDQILSTFKFN